MNRPHRILRHILKRFRRQHREANEGVYKNGVWDNNWNNYRIACRNLHVIETAIHKVRRRG